MGVTLLRALVALCPDLLAHLHFHQQAAQQDDAIAQKVAVQVHTHFAQVVAPCHGRFGDRMPPYPRDSLTWKPPMATLVKVPFYATL